MFATSLVFDELTGDGLVARFLQKMFLSRTPLYGLLCGMGGDYIELELQILLSTI